jgi:MFS family permease
MNSPFEPNAIHVLTRIVIYYAPNIFQSLGLTSSTISLLATGVIGVINVATTIPAICYIDRVGRKPLMIAGSTGMCLSHLVIGIIVATCSSDWSKHVAAGWVAVGEFPTMIFPQSRD